MRLILASASPRRQEYFSLLASDFEVVPSDAEETATGTPEERVVTNARSKAHSIASTHDGVIIGADTIVVVDADVLEKPRSSDEARRMLQRLSGRSHLVLTGLCVLNTEKGIERTACEETLVSFRALDNAEIDRYLATGEHEDKAGAYAIQGRAAPFVEGIRGDYYNVVGLPLCRLALLLRDVGITAQ